MGRTGKFILGTMYVHIELTFVQNQGTPKSLLKV